MSTRTPNIDLEKPSVDENYSLVVWNANSDTIDTEMALRVKTADIVNNLSSTATNKPLSAAMGTAIAGKLSRVTYSSSTASLLNDCLLVTDNTGMYTFSLAGGAYTASDLPDDVGAAYGMAVMIARNENIKTVLLSSTTGYSYTNTYLNGTWGGWQKVATDADLRSRFATISIPSGETRLIPVGSSEHAILIVVSGWTLLTNGYAWICTGYSTGANRKVVQQIGTGNVITCTADETGYTINNGSNSTAGVHVLYIFNQ